MVREALENLPHFFLFPVYKTLERTALNGELYITNIANWNRNVKVRLTYQDALTSFFPKYNECPYLTSSGHFLLRDSEAEKKLLADLETSLNLELGELTFREYDVDALARLADRGWKIWVAKTKGPITQVYLKHHPSGINWFTSDSTSSSSDDAMIGQILNNYLNGRNYVDSKGKLSFFGQRISQRWKQNNCLIVCQPLIGSTSMVPSAH